MDPPGVAPGSPTCDAGIFLLDDEPVLVERKQTNAERRCPDSNSQATTSPPGFRTGSSSGRMTSVRKLRGLESNQQQGVQSAPSYR